MIALPIPPAILKRIKAAENVILEESIMDSISEHENDLVKNKSDLRMSLVSQQDADLNKVEIGRASCRERVSSPV